MRCAISDVPKSNVTRYGGAPAAGATKRTVAANAGSAARRARKRDRIFAIMPSLFTPYVKKVKPSPRRNPPPTRLSVPCENRPQSRMPRRPWFLAILLVFLALRAAAEDVQALRARAGVRFFRSLLAADVDLPKKTIPPDQLLIVFFYVDDARGAKDLMARFGEQAKELRGLPVVTETTKDATLSAYAQRVPAGLFIAQPPNKKTLASIIKYGIDHHVIVYSPYEGHVESGVLGGLFVDAQMRPFVNGATLSASHITLKDFFLKVAKVYP